MRVLIAAGGTGGHIVPALAVAAALEDRRVCSRSEILFVGAGKEIEGRLIGGAGYALKQIPSQPILGKGLRGVFDFIVSFLKTIRRTHEILDDHKPEVVIAFGGYPSMGPAVVAYLRGLPLIVQEQNVQVGLANKLLSLIAKSVFAVPGAKGFLKSSHVVFQPNPVRKELGTLAPWRPPGPGEHLRLLVMGGSQGAVSLNTGILALIPKLKDLRIEIFHQSGQVDYERVTKAYQEAEYTEARVVAFTDQIIEQYASAHLIIARAGAMSVWEISTAGRPAIFVPLKIARAHQSENAVHLVSHSAALMIEQQPGFEAALWTDIQRLFSNPELLAQMAKKMREASKIGDLTPAEVIVQSVVKLRT